MISDDAPISAPADDRFGIDPFCQALAKAIANLRGPEGTVVALTGPWGSGKSSAINLIRHHLKPAEAGGHVKIIAFNPWWYSDEEALTQGFFQHLYAGLGKSLSESARKGLLGLAKGLLRNGGLIALPVNFLTFGLGGDPAARVAAALSDMIEVERTVEMEYEHLAGELRKQQSKLLIMIDDIDRLTPEQALLVFRLVKSVGRLPNTIYLLAFDRSYAERALAQRYPAERQFLEKIVQASFEVPPTDPTVLHDALLKAIIDLVGGHPSGDDGVRFRNVLTDVIYPLVSLPRDLTRFLSNVSVVLAAVGEEVNVTDLLAIEALRLFRHPVYQAVRSHAGMLLTAGGGSGDRRDLAAEYDSVFLGDSTEEREKGFCRTALRRLFPQLDSVWSNTSYPYSRPTWRAQRRICDPAHYPSYFQLTLSPDVLPRRVIESLMQKAGDPDYVRAAFREHAKRIRKDGKSDIPILLSDLTASADQIATDAIPKFLCTISSMADELDIEHDEEIAGMGFGNISALRWLTKALIHERLSQSERSNVLREVLSQASLRWAVVLADWVHGEHDPTKGGQVLPPAERLVDGSAAAELISGTLEHIRQAAGSGKLSNLRHLVYILHTWHRLTGEPGQEVREYTGSKLADDRFILRMADALTATILRSAIGWNGMGDRVSRRIVQVRLDRLDDILDVPRFLQRVEEVGELELRAEDREILAKFQEGMRNAKADEERRGAPVPPVADLSERD